ncbi:MAG TPA: hypothetical protein VHH36_06690, partial [Candidatus Thermoplasmatota archaeon]|nr:hypothetical protein [Candidatus Thermoplasmatota archaeon]
MRRALLLAAVALAGCLGAARDEPTPPPPPDAALERTFAVRVVQARDGGVGEVRAFNCVLASGDAVVKGGEVTATWTAA